MCPNSLRSIDNLTQEKKMEVFENDKRFCIARGPASEFAESGYGVNGTIYCDNTMERIEPGDTCYYIAVLNMIFCEREFVRWYISAENFHEDRDVEERRWRIFLDNVMRFMNFKNEGNERK